MARKKPERTPEGFKPIRIYVDDGTDVELKKWAKAEGASKRRFLATQMRKLVARRRDNPAALQQLGLML